MVNEINKPPTPDHLNERLAASNRQLREMQEEHRQLLQEMEALRERATALNRLSQQRQQVHLQQRRQSEEQNIEETQQKPNETTNIVSNEAASNPSIPPETSIESNTNESTESNETSSKSDKESNADSADYIQQKLAEIAALKSQYKRVQHMVETTKLIEDHLSSKSILDESKSEQQIPSKPSSTSASSKSAAATVVPAPAEETPTSTSQDPKEELLKAMLGMFTDFSDDLRGQAESLRAERERIRNLKEMLLQRRKDDS